MSILYSLKEAIAGLKQAKLSTIISIGTVAFLLIILSLFVVVSYNVDRLANLLNAQVQIQAFVAETITEQEIGELSAKLLDLKEVERIDFVSKEDAAREFKQEFGEELFDILDENPLPSSFLIMLTPENRSEGAMKQAADEIAKHTGISEVVFHGQALSLLNRYAQISKLVNIFIIILVALGSLFIISNTIRLIILSRRDIIETMKLVGATKPFIRLPFYFEGLFQGLGGGIVASAILYSVFILINLNWPNILMAPSYFVAVVLLTGGAFGVLGSAIAIKKFL